MGIKNFMLVFEESVFYFCIVGLNLVLGRLLLFKSLFLGLILFRSLVICYIIVIVLKDVFFFFVS